MDDPVVPACWRRERKVPPGAWSAERVIAALLDWVG